MPRDVGLLTDNQTFLLLCPTHRDDRELALVAGPGRTFIRHDYASLALEEMVSQNPFVAPPFADPLAEIETILEKISGTTIAGVISTDDYPGSTLACAVAQRLNLPGASPAVNLLCQHKYRARRLQRAVVPEAVPPFALVDVIETKALPFPLALPTFVKPVKSFFSSGVQRKALPFPIALPAFVKPVKSFFSIGAQRVDSARQLAPTKRYWDSRSDFFGPFERLFEHYVGVPMGKGYLLAEGLLSGLQCTLEGYAFGGDVHLIGIVDSVMFPGTNVFERFQYPSVLPGSVQDRMADIARTLMASIGYWNAMFNIEFFYDPVADSVSIIEVNPRMASQFADLYEKVDGFNTYSVLLDLAAGIEPRLLRRQGQYRAAASFVLRSFEDMHVAAVPSAHNLERLGLRHPDARVEILASAGRNLSSEMQDGASFRYGVVNVGARDQRELFEKFEEFRRDMGFVFLPVSSVRDVSGTPDFGRVTAAIAPA
jgi:biotin carboxylase